MPPPYKPVPRFREPLLVGSWSAFKDDRMGLLMRVARECGEFGEFRVGPVPLYLVNSPKMLHVVLSEKAAFFSPESFAKNFTPVLGRTALPAIHGERHRKIRRIMAPAFTPKRLNGYCEQMATLTDEAQRTLVEGADVDMIAVTHRLTRDMIAKAVFLMDINEEDSFFDALRTVAEFIAESTANPLRLPLSVPTPKNKLVRDAIAFMRGRAQSLIALGRERGDKGDVLSMLLLSKDEDGVGLTSEELLDQALTLYLAGHETTSNALSWLWLSLARFPEIQARLHAELDSVLGGRLPTHGDLPRLPYTLQVIKESMRLFPPANLFGREPTEDIEVEGYGLRKGQVLLISPYVIHRHPEYFPDPERFDPERFTLENEKKLPRGVYIPFSSGPHVCIGQHFALMEMQLTVAHMCQNVSFSLVSDQPVRPLTASTLAPSPFLLKVNRRRAAMALAS